MPKNLLKPTSLEEHHSSLEQSSLGPSPVDNDFSRISFPKLPTEAHLVSGKSTIHKAIRGEDLSTSTEITTPPTKQGEEEEQGPNLGGDSKL